MATVDVGSIVQVRMNYIWNGQKQMNTFAYVCSLAPAGAEYAEAMAAFHGQFWTPGASLGKAIQAAMSTEAEISSLTYQVLAPVRLRALTTILATNGNIDSGPVTQNVAAVVERRGDIASRRGVSTLHIPAPATNVTQEDGIWGNAYTTLLTTVATRLRAPIITAVPEMTWSPIIVNPNGPGGYTFITASFPQTTVRVMTRRTVGRGE